MLPAVGQGALGVECRADDANSRSLLAAIDHPASAACVRAERALLAALDGSCHTPIAGCARIAAGRLDLRALIARPDGSECLRAQRAGPAEAGEALGREVGLELRARAGPGFFA
jgi:hydroxymethylbilane synthase